jgi:hypothetical protein
MIMRPGGPIVIAIRDRGRILKNRAACIEAMAMTDRARILPMKGISSQAMCSLALT